MAVKEIVYEMIHMVLCLIVMVYAYVYGVVWGKVRGMECPLLDYLPNIPMHPYPTLPSYPCSFLWTVGCWYVCLSRCYEGIWWV